MPGPATVTIHFAPSPTFYQTTTLRLLGRVSSEGFLSSKKTDAAVVIRLPLVDYARIAVHPLHIPSPTQHRHAPPVLPPSLSRSQPNQPSFLGLNKSNKMLDRRSPDAPRANTPRTLPSRQYRIGWRTVGAIPHSPACPSSHHTCSSIVR